MGQSVLAAIVAAVAGLFTAMSGIVFTVVKFRDERRERERQFQKQDEKWSVERDQWSKQQRVSLKTQFFHEIVERRLDTYGAVPATLGNSRDVPDPDGRHYATLEEGDASLASVGQELLGHVYGPAGLVMSMETRNQLLSAWYTLELYPRQRVPTNKVVSEFFRARRALRADLQIDDRAAPLTVASIERDLGL